MRLAKAEAAVLSFSYTVILMLVVPIAIVMTLDLVFYVKELIAQANYPSLTNTFSWNWTSPGSSVKLSDLLRRYTVVTSEKFVFANSETFYRIKTFVEVATFLLIVSSHLQPKSSFSPLKKPSSVAANKRGRIKNAAHIKTIPKDYPQESINRSLQSFSSPQNQRFQTSDPQDRPNVCSLCRTSMPSSVLKETPTSLKRVSFVSKHKPFSAPTFWDSFQFLWSGLLHRSMRMIKGLPALQMLKFQELNFPVGLSQLGLPKSSIFTSKAVSILCSTSRLPNKRRWVKMMGRSQ